MRRLLPVCESSPPKKVKSKEDVSKCTKIYEKNKRQRAFQNCRKQGRTWLVFKENAMFCPVCKEAAAEEPAVDARVSHKNIFISGNCQFKLSS